MSIYAVLARYYDILTRDVDYTAITDYYEDIFRLDHLNVRTILDLACGTGTLTNLLSERGYEMIGTDMSEDMLSAAFDKAETLLNKPMFLCQAMESLDLYGTVDAAVCSMDGFNYLKPELLGEAFRRVLLFLEPNGIFIFDIQPPERLEMQDGEIFLDETDELFCAWRAVFDKEKKSLLYGMDLFVLEGERWARYKEEHIEYAHTLDTLEDLLIRTGFVDVRLYGDLTMKPPDNKEARVFITARKAP